MNIVIVGCGKIGSSIAETLSKNHNITMIDTKAELVENLSTSLDILGICGNGANRSVQIEAGVEKADLLIAATSQDEINIICCLVAKKVANCKTIARIRNPIYKDELVYFKEELGLSMIINPEYTTAAEIGRVIRFPDTIKLHTLSGGSLELLEFNIEENSNLVNKSLIEIGKQITNKILVCAVFRNNEVFIPYGSFVLKENDKICIISKTEDAFYFFQCINMNITKCKNVMIIGGGKTSYYLAQELNSININTKIIEIDKNICEELAEQLPKTTIVNGDASDQDLLYEEGFTDCDAFVSLTNMDEENIMLSLFAKKKTYAKVITKINRKEYEKVLDEYDIGKIIHPKELTAKYILSYVEALQDSMSIDVNAMYSLFNDKARAYEFIVKESDISIINTPLKNIKFKKNLLVASIKHAGKFMFVNGNAIIQPGDNVIIISTINTINTIKDLLE